MPPNEPVHPRRRTRYHHTLTAAKRDDETLDAVALRLVADSAALATVHAKVEAAADHAQKTLSSMEKERNAAIEEANLLRKERDRALAELAAVAKNRDNYRVWWEAAQQGAASSVDTIAELRAELATTAELFAEQVKLTEQAERDFTEMLAEMKSATRALRRELDAATTHGRIVSLVGLVVGVVVTGLLAAAL